MIGKARVVALGEPMHGAHEPMAFRNRLIRFVVEQMGFTAVALESGFTESINSRSRKHIDARNSVLRQGSLTYRPADRVAKANVVGPRNSSPGGRAFGFGAKTAGFGAD